MCGSTVESEGWPEADGSQTQGRKTGEEAKMFFRKGRPQEPRLTPELELAGGVQRKGCFLESKGGQAKGVTIPSKVPLNGNGDPSSVGPQDTSKP